MYSVSNAFKTAMESNIKSLKASLYFYDDNEVEVTLNYDGALISIKLSSDGELGSSSMRKIEVSLIKSKLPVRFSDLGINDTMFMTYSVMTVATPATWETVHVGGFFVQEIKYSDDEETCTIIAYDAMINAMVDYKENAPVGVYWEEPPTLSEYITTVLSNCDITLGNTDFVHNDLPITEERFANMYGYKVRDLINDICKISGTVAIISPYKASSNPDVYEDRLYFKKIDMSTSIYTITLNKLISHKFKNRYGDINRVIFAREPQGDYGTPSEYNDSKSLYDTTEWKVDNDQLIDYQPIIDPAHPTSDPPLDLRSTYIGTTFVAVCGVASTGHAGAIYYYPFEAETCGYGWFEIGDRIKIDDTDVPANTKYTVVLSYTVTFDGGIKENISARSTNKTDTKVKYVSNKDQNQTQLVVDKQNNVIRTYVSQTNGNTTSIGSLEATMRSFDFSLKQSGGYNVLQNSVMYNYDGEYVPKIWTVDGTGSLAISYIGLGITCSGNEFTLSGSNGTSGKTVSQLLNLTPDSETVANKNYYSLSFKLKKSIGTAWARFRYADDQYVYVLGITSSAIENYTTFKLESFLPTEAVNYVELYGSANSESSFTDVMLERGDKSTEWTLSKGELTNENVIIDKTGIVVKGNNAKYSTVITPVEFSGQYDGETVFTLNQDVTEVNNLKVQTEISLPPLRIYAYEDGWAVIRS